MISAVYPTPGKRGVDDVFKLDALRAEGEKAAQLSCTCPSWLRVWFWVPRKLTNPAYPLVPIAFDRSTNQLQVSLALLTRTRVHATLISRDVTYI